MDDNFSIIGCFRSFVFEVNGSFQQVHWPFWQSMPSPLATSPAKRNLASRMASQNFVFHWQSSSNSQSNSRSSRAFHKFKRLNIEAEIFLAPSFYAKINRKTLEMEMPISGPENLGFWDNSMVLACLWDLRKDTFLTLKHQMAWKL